MAVDPSLYTTNKGSGRSRLPAQPTFTGLKLGPGYTTTQKNAIASPPEGMVVYDTTLNALCLYNGTAWVTVTAS